MCLLNQDLKTKIAKELKMGLTFEKIVKNHPRIEILQEDINYIKKTSILLKYQEINGIIYRKCCVCKNIKQYSEKFYGKSKETKSGLSQKCKMCSNQIAKNKRIIEGDKWRKKHREYVKKYNQTKRDTSKTLIGNMSEEKQKIRRAQWKKAGETRKQKRKLLLLQKIEALRNIGKNKDL